MNESNSKLDDIASSVTMHLATNAEKKRLDRIRAISNSIKYYDDVLRNYPMNFNIDPAFEKSALNYWDELFPQYTVAYAALWYGHASGVYDVRYLHDGVFYSMCDPYFNNEDFALKFDNKAYYPVLFHDIIQPRMIAVRINGFWLDNDYNCISFERVLQMCIEERNVVIKYAKGSCGGRGVYFINWTEINKIKEVLLSSILDIVIQSEQTQYDELRAIHAASLNTIRIMTLLTKHGAVTLSSVLRMGKEGSRVDNASNGGIVCGIDTEGRTKELAFDKYANLYIKHPSGRSFSHIQIPRFTDCINLSTKLQERFPYCRMISWDWAISENGTPVLIEANFANGELDFHQLCNGPIFGDYTESLMEEVICGTEYI